jgi:adenylate cyclase, class 2
MGTYEVEVKAVVQVGGPFNGSSGEVARIEKELIGSGAVLIGHFEHNDLYLAHPCRDLSKSDEGLRLRYQKRLEDGECRSFITYKGPKLSERSKARAETELEVTDIEKMKEIFLHMGFTKVMRVVKYRTFFDLGKMRLCLDMVKGLGYFLEAEIMSDDIKGAEDELLEFMKGLELERFERRSYLELLLEKQV